MTRQDSSETAQPGARTLVLHPVLRRADARLRDPLARLEEAVGLARAIDVNVIHAEVVRVTTPRAGHLLGRGRLDDFKSFIEANEIELAIFDTALSPVQQRNLERAWKCKVIDRTALILEIFGARARTREGRLQVELAHLSYQRSRLVRSWTHLERQRGGSGFLGGPGESQIELDRRLIDERIARIKKDLVTVTRTRGLHRESRRRVPYPTVALVGYTNAGKSTLFNRLSRAEVMAKDMLFATLDPTMRRVDLPSGRTAILSDTVGFISDLPTHLVAAFRATLEEVSEADLILHVRDISHPETVEQKADVEEVLGQLGLADRVARSEILEVLNKLDLLPAEERAIVVNQAERSNDAPVPVSALTGEGCDILLARVDERLGVDMDEIEVAVPVGDGRAIAWLYSHGEVLDRADRDDTIRLRVRLAPADKARYERLTAD